MAVKVTNYNTPNNILLFTEPHTAFGVQVATSLGVAVGTKKIAKAGTPVTGDLDAPDTAFTAATESNVVGVLQHDYDVTDGAANGSVLVEAFVNMDRLEKDVQALITAGVKTALDGKVQFVHGDNPASRT